MTVAGARVDQRLIHGQVCVGWVPVLGVRHLLVVDDSLAEDDFERDILMSAAPSGVKASVLSVNNAVKELSQEGDSTLVLVRSPAVMLALIEAGAPIDTVTVGGLHYREGARRFLDYVYLTSEDVSALCRLADGGVRLVAQDLPGSPEVHLNLELASGELTYDHLPEPESTR